MILSNDISTADLIYNSLIHSVYECLLMCLRDRSISKNDPSISLFHFLSGTGLRFFYKFAGAACVRQVGLFFYDIHCKCFSLLLSLFVYGIIGSMKFCSLLKSILNSYEYGSVSYKDFLTAHFVNVTQTQTYLGQGNAN